VVAEEVVVVVVVEEEEEEEEEEEANAEVVASDTQVSRDLDEDEDGGLAL
jgi:hypothetical protein